MNIEASSILDAVRTAGPRIKHFHLTRDQSRIPRQRPRRLPGRDADSQGHWLRRLATYLLQSAPPGSPTYATKPKSATDAARPDLEVVLEQLLTFLKSAERALDTSRYFYEMEGFRGD